MTERATPTTDETLRQALVELAGEPDANALLTEVIRTVDRMPQVKRRPWDVPRWERGALLVAALLATLGIGAAVALSRPPSDPKPTPSVAALVRDSVPEFIVPFRYTVPEGETAMLTTRNGTLPADTMQVLNRPPGNLTVFLVTGLVHPCEGPDAVSPSAESDGPGSTSLSREPVAFIEGLRDEIGVGIGRIRPTMLGNLPAVEAEINPSDGRCPHARLHEDRLGLGWSTAEPVLRGPSTLIVARTGRTTIGVLIKGADEDAYAEWLPIAREYVASFDFYAANR